MLKRWLERLQGPDSDPHPPRDIAMAMLLLECARADFEHAPPELEAVRAALRENFGLDDAALDRLVGDAGRANRDTVSLHAPVARLNAELSAEDKRQLIGWLWRVALADGRLDPHEEHLLRRLADLLHVSHADFIRSKLVTLAGDPA